MPYPGKNMLNRYVKRNSEKENKKDLCRVLGKMDLLLEFIDGDETYSQDEIVAMWQEEKDKK
jgi:hypothetical protein